MVNICPTYHGEFGDTVQSTIPLRIVVRHEPSPFFSNYEAQTYTAPGLPKIAMGKIGKAVFPWVNY